MATDTYDIIVLGSGPGGYVAAIRASQLGLKTAIVERELLGGICLNWGCIPTKALLRTSEIYHYLTHASAYGLKAEKPGFDLAAIVERSRKVAGQLNAGVKGLMKKNKVTVVEGEGKLTGKGKLVVTKDGAKTELQAKHIIIATGARARDLPFAKADGDRIWTYRHAMVPKEMPSKLLVVGSGAIGVEFASFYADMGAEVTIVEMLDRILPVEDEEVSAFMAKQLNKQGMKILTGAKVTAPARLEALETSLREDFAAERAVLVLFEEAATLREEARMPELKTRPTQASVTAFIDAIAIVFCYAFWNGGLALAALVLGVVTAAINVVFLVPRLYPLRWISPGEAAAVTMILSSPECNIQVDPPAQRAVWRFSLAVVILRVISVYTACNPATWFRRAIERSRQVDGMFA